MDFIKRKKSFVELGNRLKNLDEEFLSQLMDRANIKNPWFTPVNVRRSIDGLISYLDENKFSSWLEAYQFNGLSDKNVGVVMAGNIPLVGIHDFICILMSGHKLIAKLSSQDDVLIQFIAEELIKIDNGFEERIHFVDQLKNIDAAITTGSDNTARYFDFYFGKYPNIIRKNRTSIAILDGNESEQDLLDLSHDIYSYFGLGCRNVSKLFLPEGMRMQDVIPHFDGYQHLLDHTKYNNNYFYNKSILLVNQEEHLDSGFSLFQLTEKLVSPISMVFYEYYQNPEALKIQLEAMHHKIQCIVTNNSIFDNIIPFGKAQKPEIWDYADNIDTMRFLLSL